MKQRARTNSLKSTAFDELQFPWNGKSVDLGRRKVQRNRTTSSGYVSKYVGLPKVWLDFNRIEAGDELEFRMERNGTLSVRKVKDTPDVMKEVSGNNAQEVAVA